MIKIRIEHLNLRYSDGTESLKDVSLDIKAHLGPATWYVIRLPVEKTELAVGQASGNAAVSTTP